MLGHLVSVHTRIIRAARRDSTSESGAPLATHEARFTGGAMLMLDDTEIREIEDGLQKRRSQLIEEISEKLRAARDPTSSEQADELIEVGDAAIADLLTHTSLAESQRDVQELQEIEAA